MSPTPATQPITHGREVKDLFYFIVVIGGGVAGHSAAVATARLGIKVALVQNRPVLGGNSSSEIRVWVIGVATRGYFCNAHETGIVEEVALETAYRSEGLLPIYPEGWPMWDIALKEWCDCEPNLDLFLNTRAHEVAVVEDRILSVTVLQTATEKVFRLHARYFIESSGDGEIGDKASAIWQLGQESCLEFGETLAPEKANTTVLPSTIMFTARDVGRPTPFHPPDLAYDFPADEDLPFRDHRYVKSGYWWISAGGDRDTIDDNEEIRDELYKILLGVWDHIKNHGDHGADNLVLDWVGYVVGNRESRRFEGDYIIVQDDVLYGHNFPDAVAYGGWPLELHPSQGFFSPDVPTDQIEPEKPYGIPYQALYSRNIENLFLNGRLISTSHVAMGTIRVQKTLSTVGQAVGTAAAMCVQSNLTPRQLGKECIQELQQVLLKQDCYIPHVRNQDSHDLDRMATVTASSEMPLPMVTPDDQHPLYTRRAQKFITSESRIDRLAAWLVSEGDESVTVTAHLHPARDLWDFSSPEILATATATLAPGHDRWVFFEFNQPVDPSHPNWVEIGPLEGVAWRHGIDEPPGCQAAAWSDKRIVRLKLDAPAPKHAIEPVSDEGVWCHLRGTYLLRVEPQSYPYGPANVFSGVSRPERGPNVWIADPQQPWPHWLELAFPQSVTFNTLHLTFDSNLDRQIDEGAKALSGPVPELVKEYVVQTWQQAGWETLFEVRDNHQRWWRHTFQPMITKRLRILFETTNFDGPIETKPEIPHGAHPSLVRGAHTARVFEVRLYRKIK